MYIHTYKRHRPKHLKLTLGAYCVGNFPQAGHIDLTRIRVYYTPHPELTDSRRRHPKIYDK